MRGRSCFCCVAWLGCSRVCGAGILVGVAPVVADGATVGAPPCGGMVSCVWARDRVGAPLVGVWVASRERACLREVCGWVRDVEGVAFLEELFGL